MNSRSWKPDHFDWRVEGRVATITLNRPEKKNPLTFESYAELRDTFRKLNKADDVRAIVITGAGGNFCSGGDVHEIIAPLLKMSAPEQLAFTRMTGDLIIAMLECRWPIVAAVDGVCVGAGAAIATASDIRIGTNDAKVAFLFVKIGLAGCDMGACSILPRIIGQGRAAELLYTGRVMTGDEALSWGFFNTLADGEVLKDAVAFAENLAAGPSVAHQTTKRMLREEWDMGLIDAVNAEAVAQAECMQTQDFKRAYDALVNKQTPRFQGD